MSRNYEPYGTAYIEMGGKSTAYGFTSEWTDDTGLVIMTIAKTYQLEKVLDEPT